ncbi:MAG: hypothetical protein ACYCQJ_07500 [Nitrososphaerales archaeon]
MPSIELSKDQAEAILKALGYYQIQLFDLMQKGSPSISKEIDLVTSLIKEIHKLGESTPKQSGIKLGT